MAVSLEETGIKLAIAEAYSNYATGLDTKNWAMVRDCFCDQVLIDYGSISEPTGGPDVPRKADDWLEHLKGTLTGFDMTQHSITNHRFKFGEETGSCQAYLTADHIIFPNPEMPLAMPEDVVTVVGEYTNQYRREGADWKIFHTKLVVNFTTGNMALLGQAAERAAALLND